MKTFPLIHLLVLVACTPLNNAYSVTVSGITVEASNFRLEGTQAKVDICHEFPDARDWTIWKVGVEAGQIEIDEFEMSLTELRQPAVDGKQEVITLYGNFIEPDQNNGMGLRCDAVTVNGVPDNATSLRLTIESLAAYPHEGGFCELEYLDRVNAELDKYNQELEATCLTEPGVGGLEIISWPKDMERWEAENILHSEQVFMSVQGIRGPWIFEFSIQ